MKVFVTGSTGWIGTAAVGEFLAAGHDVVGLVRTDAAAAGLTARGATPLRGDLDDLGSLRRGADTADAVVHLANKHDWGDPAGSDRTERAAVATMLEVVAGTNKAFLVADGLSGIVEGRAVLETDASPAVGPDSDRGGSENLVLERVDRGVRAMAIRFAPSVHGVGDWGFLTFLANIARERGVSGYVGDGAHAWSAVHRSDAAALIRLAIEEAPAGTRLHAVAEEAVSTRVIAEALGQSLGLPVSSVDPAAAGEHFGLMAEFWPVALTGSSAATRVLSGWTPSGPTLIEDVLAGAYATDRDR